MKTPGENNSVTKFVFQNYILKVKEMRRILFLAVAMTVIGIFTEVKLTEILKDIPEYFQDEDKFRILIVELAIFGLIYSFSSELTGYFVAGPLQTIFTKSMKDSLKAYINLNYTTFKEVGVGKILKNMDRISSSTGELIAVVINQILPIPIFIFFLSISILRNISLLVLTIISFHIFLYIIFTFKITDLRTKLRRIANEELNKTNNISNEILCNYEGIKAFNNESYELERFDKQLKKIIKPTRKLWQSLYFLNLVQKNVLICMDIVICILFFVKRNDPSITNQKIVIQYFLITNIIRKKFSNLGSTYGMFMIMHTNIKTSMMPESEEELGDEIKFKEQIKFQNVSLSNTDK
ncbi:putative mitochondrial ABC transporter, partial [Tubulinosema ratisbonensis]